MFCPTPRAILKNDQIVVRPFRGVFVHQSAISADEKQQLMALGAKFEEMGANGASVVCVHVTRVCDACVDELM